MYSEKAHISGDIALVPHSTDPSTWARGRYVAKFENAAEERLELRLRSAPLMGTSDLHTCSRERSPKQY